MKKIIAGLLIGIILAVPVNSETNMICEECVGVCFYFPEEWSTKENSETTMHYYPQYSTDDDGNTTGLFQVFRPSIDISDKEVDTFFYKYKVGAETSDSNPRYVSYVERRDIQGITAEYNSGTQEINGDIFDYEEIILVNEGHAASISYIKKQNTDGDFEDDFNRIVESATLIDASIESGKATEASAETNQPVTQEEQVVVNEPSVGEKNALREAESYLDYSSFSKEGLKGQLLFEGFEESEAEYAVNNVSVDWNEQAYQTALSYLDYSSFSKQGLLDQLLYEGFTQAEAEYGVEKAYQ